MPWRVCSTSVDRPTTVPRKHTRAGGGRAYGHPATQAIRARRHPPPWTRWSPPGWPNNPPTAIRPQSKWPRQQGKPSPEPPRLVRCRHRSLRRLASSPARCTGANSRGPRSATRRPLTRRRRPRSSVDPTCAAASHAIAKARGTAPRRARRCPGVRATLVVVGGVVAVIQFTRQAAETSRTGSSAPATSHGCPSPRHVSRRSARRTPQ
jgi:hypothetical protein